MITLNYNNFINGTGSFPGNASFGPDYAKDYALLYSGVANLNKSDPIITFSNFPANLKIVDYSLDPPFDRAYLDVAGGDVFDTVLLENYGQVWQDIDTLQFQIAYTSGGFWSFYNGERVTSIATGTKDTNIAELEWNTVTTYELNTQTLTNGFLEINSPTGFMLLNFDGSAMSSIPFSGFKFDKNQYSWQRRRVSFSNGGPLSFIVSGVDSNNSIKTLEVNPDTVDWGSIEFYWSGNNLFYNELAQDLISPLPIDQLFYDDPNGLIISKIYPDEPMINYTVINNHTIRIETDINTLPTPLRKLYIQFSGIS